MRMIMKKSIKRFSLAVGVISVFGGSYALAQTPVSASVSMSGSCASCDLSNRDMPHLSIQGSDFSNSDFSRSNLSGGKFHNSNLQGASFHKSYLMRVEGTNVLMRGAILRDSTLIEAILTDCDISRADLRRADMTAGQFDKSRFILSNLRNVDAIQTSFVGADLSRAKLDHANFTDANFDKAIFVGTKFGDAILENATFLEANFSDANLSKVQGLTQKQLEFACGNADTRLPNDLHVKTCVYTPEPVEVTSTLVLVPRARISRPGPPPVVMVSQDNRSVLKFVMAQKAKKRVARNDGLEEAMAELKIALREIPSDSSLHKHLSKVHALVEQAHAQEKVSIWASAPED
ncbi:MAG: hypothetical protein COA69_13880 [Robiginitomaculum sp.]|nr:MAG: hypothetical protein COA69_13880 [Robiginitomaculum sp.]